MRKDIVKGPAQRLDELRESSPEFVQMAQDKLAEWDGKNYLVGILAKALEEAFIMGQHNKRPRVRPRGSNATIEDELAQASPQTKTAKRVGRTPPDQPRPRVPRSR